MKKFYIQLKDRNLKETLKKPIKLQRTDKTSPF